jgi:hypothetical protein
MDPCAEYMRGRNHGKRIRFERQGGAGHGGNGGIGLGMAEGMAQAGADVVIWGGNPQKNATAEAKLRSYGRRVLAQRCDVADETQVEACLAEALKQMGRIDACFANAGVSQARAFVSRARDERVAPGALGQSRRRFLHAARRGAPHGGACDGGRQGRAPDRHGEHRGRARRSARTGVRSQQGRMLAMMRALAVEMARYGSPRTRSCPAGSRPR